MGMGNLQTNLGAIVLLLSFGSVTAGILGSLDWDGGDCFDSALFLCVSSLSATLLLGLLREASSAVALVNMFGH